MTSLHKPLVSLLIGSVIVLTLCKSIQTTEVKPCPGKVQLLSKSVEITGCDVPPCTLKAKHNITVSIRFKLDSDVSLITNNVNAKIGPIAAPFIGVDGTSACKQIYLLDGTTPAKCPLKGNEEYLFRNTIHISELYPKISTVVHWALKDRSTRKDITCFEVNAKITN